MSDRRCNGRWPIHRLCGVKLRGAKSFASCKVQDFSLKGLQIITERKLPEDTAMKLSLFLHEKFTLNIETYVAWHKAITEGDCYGLDFSRVKDVDKERIFRFVFENYPKLIARSWWREFIEEKGGEEMVDHRIFDRRPVKFPMRFIDPRSGAEGKAQMQDISAKGIGLVTPSGFPRKTELEMWIEVPDEGGPLYTRGEVVWSQMVSPDKFRTGVCLEKADLMGLSRVLRVVE
ncbi:MAG: PilZ domain-containing protein [Candidatus Omnitrophota bacterium]